MFNLNANKSGLICFTQDCECKLNLQQCLIVSVCLYIFLFFLAQVFLQSFLILACSGFWFFS